MIKINISQINKNSIKSTFVGKINFSNLEKIARFTAREESGGGDDLFFQRPTDIRKINKIVGFIEKSIFDDYASNTKIKKEVDILSLFPTAMILSVNSNNDNCINLREEKGGYILEIDQKALSADAKPIFIVDGQHRLEGVKNFYEKHPDVLSKLDIEFPITVLLGYDMYEQAKIFANVNFEQKPVNKSLYYDIFGSLPYEKNQITLAHYIVKYLNENNNSPLKNMVKMLGVGDGVISQAFMVEKIMDLFKSGNVFREQFINYRENGTQHKNILKIIINYLNALSEEFNEYWPIADDEGKYSSYKYKNILMKTTGVGAMFKFLNYLGSDIYNADKEYFKNIFRIINKVISNNGGKNIFGSEGKFAKAGGAGLQDELFKELKFRYEYMKFLTKKYKEEDIIDARRIKLNGISRNDIHFTDGTGNNPTDQEISDEPFQENDSIRIFIIK